MLYLIATPIGNLGDFTFRASKLLENVDLILCEDTRTSGVLLKAYGIKKPLKSYHIFNAAQVEDEIIRQLHEGKEIALLSDAGTPGISDPGERLVSRCQKEGILVSALPGPCAPIMALTISGLPTEMFQFIGFLPKKAGEERTLLAKALGYEGTTICFESPNRIYKTLELIKEMAPTRTLVIARELTKIHEEVLKGTAEELSKHTLRGEIVLLIAPAPPLDFTALTPQQHVELLQKEYGISKQEAIKMAAQLRGTSKKEIYF